MLILGYHLSYLEFFASITSFASIVLAAKGSILNWPLGIIGQILFFILFLLSGLYGQMILQVIFTTFCIYGWINWRKPEMKIKSLTKKQNLILYPLLTFLCLIGYYFLSSFQQQFALLDAIITISSIFAVFLITKKYINAWYLWIMLDILSIVLFGLKGIKLISIEYIFITGVAIFGYINWIKIYKKQ
jgi:nicotinamide mononucleotide transporter